MSFKEMFIYTVFKDTPVCKTTGLTMMLRYYGMLYEDINIQNIYRAIINYQIKRYGGQLETDRASYIDYRKPSVKYR